MDRSRIKRTERDVPYIAVGVCDTGENTHAGVVHRDHDAVRFLEQRFHYATKDDPVQGSVQACDGRFLFIVPDLEEDRARNVVGMCRLIAKYRFPYALAKDGGARFDPFTGELAMPNGIGLSCATFVIVVFRSCRVRLIDFAGWPVRPDDADAQQKLVQLLESWRDKGRVSTEHVEKVRNEIGCVRARPEEVAGVCMLDLPGKYPAAEAAGSVVLAALDEL